MALDTRLNGDDFLDYQSRALTQVSRTFALTVPQLPLPVRSAIGNAYLLCRIADTIEDEPVLDQQSKRRMLLRFSDVVQGNSSAESFSTDIKPLLSKETPRDERDLVSNTPMIVEFNLGLSQRMSKPIERCVKIMCEGMAEFVGTDAHGLPTVDHLDRYTYYVAGVVGEMITDVISAYSPQIAAHRDELFDLSSQFGRGLQLVNIIKDHNEDSQRGVSWLPNDGFGEEGQESFSSDYDGLSADPRIPFLVNLARQHLEGALSFTLLIPPHERGIRRFLVWTLGLAALTLRRIAANPQFKSGSEVKVSRRQVAGMIAASRFSLGSNTALRWLFNSAAPPLSSNQT